MNKQAFERRIWQPDAGGHTSVYWTRSGPGRTVVLIPGSFNDERDWIRAAEHLDAEFHVMIVPLYGHGGSWPPSQQASIGQFADEVTAVIAHAGVERFYVGGHSIGGMIALEIGHQLPERVLGVISCEGWTHYAVETEAFGKLKVNTLTEAQMSALQAQSGEVKKGWTEEQIRRFAQVWRSWDGSAFLNTTELPVLEIWGDRGLRPRPERRQLRIPERPSVRLRWIDGGSHYLTLQYPLQVGRAIADFLRDAEGRVLR